MYLQNKMQKSKMRSVQMVEGESIEQKIERITANKEPIKDGAPEIFTERKDGVIAAYNIRTDRWEIAAEAMDKVAGSIQAKREERQRMAEEKLAATIAGEKGEKDGAAKSIQGESPKGDTK